MGWTHFRVFLQPSTLATPGWVACGHLPSPVMTTKSCYTRMGGLASCHRDLFALCVFCMHFEHRVLSGPVNDTLGSVVIEAITTELCTNFFILFLPY